MLSVLTGEKIVNVLAVTTRYFGGIKLGTGGLVNVYKKGVKEALKQSGKRDFISYIECKINFPINKTDIIQYELKKENIIIKEKKFINTNAEFIVDAPENAVEKLEEKIKIISGNIKRITLH
jgi:putative IMPACT (imprinted ancient) family translation regulator